MSTYFLSTAQELVHQSQSDVEKGDFLKSWGRAIPARLAFLADAVVHAVILPFKLLALLYYSIEFVFTWGKHNSSFWSSATDADETLNRTLRSLLGAVISVEWADRLHQENAQPFEWALGALMLASPNLFFYSPKNGWSFGWSLISS